MKLHPKLIGGIVGAIVILASPVQASSWGGDAAGAASQAGNSAVQSAVRAARDDAARRAMAQHHWNLEMRRAHRHDRSR